MCVRVYVRVSFYCFAWQQLKSKLVFVRFSFPSEISPKLIRSEIGGKTAVNQFLKV